MEKRNRRLACILLVAVILVIYELRLVQWQFVEVDKYSKISESSSSFFIKLNGARGEILDKNGNALAGNRTTYNVVMNAITMESKRNPAIGDILTLLREWNIPWTDKLPIQLNPVGSYEFKPDMDSEISYLKSASMLNMQEYATADECMAALVRRYDCGSYTREKARDLVSVRYNMTKTQFNMGEPYVIARDVPIEFIQIISERGSDMPGIETRVSTGRDYGDGTTAPHVIGALGSISQEEYDALAAKGNTYSADNVSGYSYTETVGRSGIESVFEDTLRGKNGKETIAIGSVGEVVSTEVTEAPEAGNSVHLTIDGDLQRVATESLKRNIEAAPAPDCTAGAAVVLDMKTFGVLTSATYPTFDMERYTKDDAYYSGLMEDETKPLFNRALDGIFTPGSVMKPAVGLAALEEGVITLSESVECTGAYNYYEHDPLSCLDVHGYVNVIGGLQKSCNVFFCDVGRRLGIEKMAVYANLLSLGEKTGVEISEAAGIMSNPEEYRYNHGVDWVDGITIQAAIGQADSMFTPIQLATYCATIGNNGVRMKTHFLDKVTDYDNKKVMKQYEPQVAENMELSQASLDIIQEGMLAVCQPGGSGSRLFGDYGITIAGKTGTAQNPNHSDNVVFMAYAPYDNPEIAVAVILEYGASSIYAQNVAKDIFDCYFYDKTLEVKARELEIKKTDVAENSPEAVVEQ